MKHLVTTAFLYPPSVPPPSRNTPITLRSPPSFRNEFKAWREWESKPPPKTPEEACRLVVHRPDVDGLLLLSFLGLPLPHSVVEAPPLADGLKFQLHTLPVDAKAVADGDTLTVYVSTSDARESSRVPPEVQTAVVERDEACAERNYTKADALHKQITNAGYRVLHIDNQDILARKYRIRLRGIDAPESSMPYGKEAKDELVKMIDGKCLKILIFDEDRYGRFVGDVYCNGIFVQESLLKKGLAWHYTDYDKRPELEKVIDHPPLVKWLSWFDISGRKMPEQRESGCGLHQNLKCHGNGGRIAVKTDIHTCIRRRS